MSLAMWVTQNVFGIEDLLLYIGDTFSFDSASNTDIYKPYSRVMPSKQADLLQLLDTIRIPYNDIKQVHSYVLAVVGLEVDPNTMSVTMPDDT